MIIKEISELDLLVTKCKCGHTNIWGYPGQQNYGNINEEQIQMNLICKKCKRNLSRIYDIIYLEVEFINGDGI